MRPIEEFLSLVMPARGTRVITQIGDGPPKNYTYDEQTSFAEIADDVIRLDAQGHDVYIALGGFEAETVSRYKGRTADNARWFKSLFIDIDVGEDKDYKNRREAVAALEDFVNSTGLPGPAVVNSGYGFHVYWPLEQEIPREEWFAYATKLKTLAAAQGLNIDPSCTADAARILRPVGARNFKRDTPKPVKLVQYAPPLKLEIIVDKLAGVALPTAMVLAPSVAPKVNGHASAAAMGLAKLDTARPSDFSAKKIVNNCQQFKWAYNNQAEVKEPLWRAMIGTLYNTDNPASIHKFSSKHPQYTEAETEAKASAWTGGGVTCATLASLRPGGCNGCAHQGLIKSPSALGVNGGTATSAEPPPKIDPTTGLPDAWTIKDNQIYLKTEEGLALLYNGAIEFGVPFKEKDPLSKNDIQYLPLTATTEKDTHGLYLHMGMHASPQELKKAFSTVGILPETRMEKEFYNGMRAWIQEITDKSTSVKPVRQMGWQSHEAGDTEAGFVLGDTLYLPGKEFKVRVDIAAEKHSKHMHPQGSYDEWKRAINTYCRPEYYGFGLMSWLAFGAPLARLLGIGMPVAHFNSQGSGHGKTGTQDLLLSAAGNPRDPNGRWTGNTTIISIYAYLTAMNGNIAILDETSALPKEVLLKLMFEATLGSGRKAMAGSSGQTRDLPPISGILCTSGNISLQQLAQVEKGNSEAQVARVFEFNVQRPNLTTEQRYKDAETFKLVYENYGHAMPQYIRYVVDNQAKVKTQLARVEKQLIDKLGMANEERFWRGLMTVCITGAMIAKKLGIINHDINAMLPAAFAHYEYQRATMSQEDGKGSHALYQFVQDNQSTVLVVDSNTPTVNATGMSFVTPLRTPAAHVNTRMRYVTDTGLLYVDKKFLRAYCSDKNLDFRLLLHTAQLEGWLVQDNERVTLTAHTRVNTPARVVCVIFDMKKAQDVVQVIKGQ